MPYGIGNIGTPLPAPWTWDLRDPHAGNIWWPSLVTGHLFTSGPPPPRLTSDGCWSSTHGQYTCYWNIFLFCLSLLPKCQNIQLFGGILRLIKTIKFKCSFPPYCFKHFILYQMLNLLSVSSGGRLTYGKVKAFQKKQYSMTSVYKSISTSSNNTITLSENHLIYARKNCRNKFNQV